MFCTDTAVKRWSSPNGSFHTAGEPQAFLLASWTIQILSESGEPLQVHIFFLRRARAVWLFPYLSLMQWQICLFEKRHKRTTQMCFSLQDPYRIVTHGSLCNVCTFLAQERRQCSIFISLFFWSNRDERQQHYFLEETGGLNAKELSLLQKLSLRVDRRICLALALFPSIH